MGRVRSHSGAKLAIRKENDSRLKMLNQQDNRGDGKTKYTQNGRPDSSDSLQR